MELRRISERVDGRKVYPYTIHKALVEIECGVCGGTIEPPELFVPWKDRGLSAEYNVLMHCWDCFPFDEFEEGKR
jgi:hypothetical protein